MDISKLVQDEALALCYGALEILEDHREVVLKPGDGAAPKGKAVAAIAKIDSSIREVNQIQDEVRENRCKVAVLGPLKAGKSTTINAIVGVDVVPSRDEGMTMIPTIVEHVPGERSPQLNVHGDAIRDLIEFVIKTDAPPPKSATASEALADLFKDLRGLRVRVSDHEIERGGAAQSVPESLLILNDLARIAMSVTDGSAKSDAAQLIERMGIPEVYVEFRSLSVLGDRPSSRLALIDTPGPDEARNLEYLEATVDRILGDVHAAILVLNAKTVESRAHADIRGMLLRHGDFLDGRVRVFANQIDTLKERTDNDFATLRRRVSENIFIDDEFRVTPKDVFPVCAVKAKWATNLKGLSEGERTRTPYDSPFRREFRIQADASEEAIQGCIDLCWQESMFEEPLESVMREGWRKATINVARKCVGLLQEVTSHLRQTGAIARIHGQRENLERLLQECEAVLAAWSEAQEEVHQRVDSLKKTIATLLDSKSENSLIKDWTTMIRNWEKACIPAGKVKELPETTWLSAKCGDRVRDAIVKSRRPIKVLDQSLLQSAKATRTRHEASGKLDQFEVALKKVAHDVSKRLRGEVNCIVELYVNDLRQAVVERMQVVVERLENLLEESGIARDVVPQLDLNAWANDQIPTPRLPKIGRRIVPDGYEWNPDEDLFGGVRRFFGDLIGTKWGRTKKEKTREEFHFDAHGLVREFAKELRAHIQPQAGEPQERLMQAVDDRLDDWMAEMFDSVNQFADKIRDEKAPDAKSRDSETRQVLVRMELRAERVQDDVRALNSGLSTASGPERKS